MFWCLSIIVYSRLSHVSCTHIGVI